MNQTNTPVGKLIPLPLDIFYVGLRLASDIYLHMEINQQDVLFRKKGEFISDEDLKVLLAAPALAIRTKFSQLGDLALFVRSDQIERSIKSQDFKSRAVKSAAAGILASVGQSSLEARSETLRKVAETVENIIATMKHTPSVKTYFRLLESSRKSGNVLDIHNKEVSAIAVLILLNLGAKDSDELSDIATSGLLHDIGLSVISKQVLQAHCGGKNDFKSEEKIVFRKHLDTTLELISKNKILVSERVLLAITQHHENWDGSGYKGIIGNKISRDARILRIADELACKLAESPANQEFLEILRVVSETKSAANFNVFDPDIILTLLEATKAEQSRLRASS